MKVIDGSKYYDSKEICALLGVAYITLLKYWSKGILNSIKQGRYRYSSEEDIKEYLNGKIKNNSGKTI